MSQSFLRRMSQNFWVALVWTLVIFLLMTIPKSDIPHRGLFGIPHLDKLVHAVIFGVFAMLWHQILVKNGSSSKNSLMIVLALAVAYGTAMEFYQHFFTDRDFDVWDILADSAGAVVAVAWMGLRGKK